MYIILKSGDPVAASEIASDTIRIADVFGDMQFAIYPNPTKGVIHINISGGSNTAIEFTLYSLGGTLIRTLQRTSSLVTIDVSDQPTGMYILVCRINDQRKEWKIIKE